MRSPEKPKKRENILVPLPDTDDRLYHLTVHKSGNYRYASTQPQFLNKSTGEKVCRHVHWGTLDDNNRFYPNKRFVEASVEERSRLVFPKEWDLSEITDASPEELHSVTRREVNYRDMMKGFQTEKEVTISSKAIFRLIHKLMDSGVESDRILDILISLEE